MRRESPFSPRDFGPNTLSGFTVVTEEVRD